MGQQYFLYSIGSNSKNSNKSVKGVQVPVINIKVVYKHFQVEKKFIVIMGFWMEEMMHSQLLLITLVNI